LKLAIFDIDGTLIRGRSTERRFFAYLFRQGQIGLRQQLRFVMHLLPAWRRHGRHALKKNKAYLHGLHEQTIAQLAARWVETLVAEDWCEPVVQRLEAHLAAGDRVVLLTGTLSVVAAALSRRLGAHEARGSQILLDGGRYRGSELTSHPFGEEKRTIVKQLAQQADVTARDVVAYGDSIHDAAMLRWVGQPVATRPDRRLADVARRNGWEIIGSRRE